MNTARERYEAKTKVVTFRFSLELYGELKKIQAESGLSFADLVKLGAGIARDEIRTKMEEFRNLQETLEELKAEIQVEKQQVSEMRATEKQVQLETLEREIKVFRFFDLGWTIEEVMLKMEMGRGEVSNYFNEWAEMRGEKEKVQAELLKKCVRRHFAVLSEQIAWRAMKGAVEEAKIQLERCRYLLVDPSRATEDEKIFLLTEYSYSV
jgi:DNA repair exonuclease SbcCD ATPase subunit